MGEFKIHHAVSELIDSLGLTDLVAPEKFVKNLVTSPSQVQISNTREIVQSLAAVSSNPAEIISKYEELRDKNYAELDPFVLILSKMKESKTVIRSVRAGLPKESAKNYCTSTDSNQGSGPSTSTPIVVGGVKLKELKSRLQTASEGSVGHPVIELAEKRCTTNEIIQKNPKWFLSRPFLSWDYPVAGLLDSQLLQIAPLGNVPVGDQERILLEELLYVLSGFDGDYIRALPLSSNIDERKFEIDESVDDSLKEMVRRFFPILASYSIIERFYESRSGFDFGMVNDALASAIGNLVHEYRIFVCQLESLLLKSELSLQKAWYLLQPNVATLHQLHHVTLSLMRAKAQGGQVLSVLHQQTMEAMGNDKQQKLLLSLTRSAAQPYWEILQKWIYQGSVEDPYLEFMVEDHQVVSMDKLSPTAYSDDYWEKRYTLRRDRVPSFLLPLTDQILRTGKYLNVIKQCGMKVKPPKVDDLSYTLDGSGYKEAIEKAYSYASETLLHVLMQDYDLLGRLKSVKYYFFLNAGDFILHFLSLCGAELVKNVDDVMPSRLESLLELALRTSTANADPFKDDLGLELLSYDLTTQMVRILSIQTHEERVEGNHSMDHVRLTGLEAFSFMYRVRWPVSLVFTTKVMACYQMIFRHLFLTKYVENLLGRVWISHKIVRNYSFPTSLWYNNAFALRHRMLHFIQNLLYYITVEVLEPSWQVFVEKIRKVDNVDQVISTHMELLNICMKESMLTDPALLQTATKLIKLCEAFAHFILKMHRHAKEAEMGLSSLANVTSLSEVLLISPGDVFLPENSDTFDQNVARMELQFTTLLADLLHRIAEMGHESYDSHMLTLLNRLDFNNYYTEKVIQFTLKSNQTDETISG